MGRMAETCNQHLHTKHTLHRTCDHDHNVRVIISMAAVINSAVDP